MKWKHIGNLDVITENKTGKENKNYFSSMKIYVQIKD